jgi:hypothetical protein
MKSTTRGFVSDKAAMARFNQVFMEELDQKAIDGMYNL